MKIGLGVYTAETLPNEQVSLHQVYQDDLEQARLAETAGLDSIWYSEHHFLEQTGYNPNVLGMCAAAAAVTSRIEIGPSVLLGPLYHPVRLAEDCAMVDQLSGGRLTVGIGMGYRDIEYQGLGVQRRRRVGRTEELIAILRQAWSGQPISFHGSNFDIETPALSPPPFQTAGPRIWIGGYAEAALDRVARLGDGWIMDGGTDSTRFHEVGYNRDLFDRVEVMVRLLKHALQRHGRRYEDLDVAVTIGGFLSEHGPDHAWQIVGEAYMHTRRVYADWYGIDPAIYQGWYPGMMRPDEHLSRRAEIWLGGPEDLTEAFVRLGRIVGDRLHVMFRNRYPGIAHEQMMKAIALMGQVRERALQTV